MSQLNDEHRNDPILIWGAGAIGGTIGAFLARAGFPVLLVDAVTQHVEAMNTQGLTISGPVDASTSSADRLDAPAVSASDLRLPTAPSMGIQVRASASEASKLMVTVRAWSRNSCPAMPSTKMIGRKTATVVKVEATTAGATARAPSLSAAREKRSKVSKRPSPVVSRHSCSTRPSR